MASTAEGDTDPLLRWTTAGAPALFESQVAKPDVSEGQSSSEVMSPRRAGSPYQMLGIGRQLVMFFNDEVLTMLAAAAWGLVVPVAAPDQAEKLWFRILAAFATVAICSAVQLALYRSRMVKGWKHTVTFMCQMLIWQPRVTWAMLGDMTSRKIQQSVIERTHCPAAAVLASCTLACACLLLVCSSLFLDRFLGDTGWQYPTRTLSLSLLQFAAKVFYDAWRLLAEGFENVQGYGNGDNGVLSAEEQAQHAAYSCAVLLLLTVTVYEACPALIRAAEQAGREYRRVRHEKLMWFTCFIWASGVADYMYDILVDYVGTSYYSSKQLGLALMYGVSFVLFAAMSAVAVWHFYRGNRRCIRVPAGELAGLLQERRVAANGRAYTHAEFVRLFYSRSEWGAARPAPALGLQWADVPQRHLVKLVAVTPGSLAAKSGLSRFTGMLVSGVNGGGVVDAAATRAAVAAAVKPFAAAAPAAVGAGAAARAAQSAACTDREVVLQFKRRETVMNALGDVLGPTAAAFLQNAMNNMFWWAFAEHVTEAAQHFDHFASRGALCVLIALSLTLLSVAVFVVNRRGWLLARERWEDDVERRRAASAEAAQRDFGARNLSFRCDPGEEDVAGPALPGANALLMSHSQRARHRAATGPNVADRRFAEIRDALGEWAPPSDAGAEDEDGFDVDTSAVRREWYRAVAEWAERRLREQDPPAKEGASDDNWRAACPARGRSPSPTTPSTTVPPMAP